MDGGIIFWLIVIGIFVVWPIIKSNRQQKKFEETVSSIPNLTIDVKIEKIKEVQCLVVYAKGWINSKKEHSISGNISLSLIDKTEEPLLKFTDIYYVMEGWLTLKPIVNFYMVICWD